MQIIPGLYGFGTDTRAAYGLAPDTNPTIYRVTNLNASGSGSLRAAIEASGPRICVFEVSGTIPINDLLKIKNPYITIAGQTAPSPGITLQGAIVIVETHDVLIQHMRIRVGDKEGYISPTYGYDTRDGLNIYNYNTVIDHCSISWAIDENTGIGGHDSTFSNCIISEGLASPLHSKYPDTIHSAGMIVSDAQNIAIIGNLFAHNFFRNPFFVNGPNSVVLVNNFIYNGGNFGNQIEIGVIPLEFSSVGNVFEGGINSGSYASDHISNFRGGWKDGGLGSSLYFYDNKCDDGAGTYTQTDANDWSTIDNRYEYDTSLFKKLLAPLWPTELTAMSSSAVKASILANAGARPADRDSVDIRVINDSLNGTGRIIKSQSDVGGWPVLAENKIELQIPSNPHADSGDGYTNLEKWLHVLAAEVEGNYVPITCNSPTDNHASGCALLNWSDRNDDGIIISMITADQHLADGLITQREHDFVYKAWAAGSINALCPGCYGEAVPAKGQIVGLTYPVSIEHGAMCDINAAIKNIGELSGRFKTQILIDDILLATSPEFTLAGGATSTDKIDPFKAPSSGESMDIIIKCLRSV